MKIGVCVGFDQAMAAKEAGFAYIEPQVVRTSQLDDAGLAGAQQLLAASGMTTPVFNVLFPGDLALLSPGSEEKVKLHLQHALARVKALGGRKVVFGSGRSRMRPEGMPYDEAYRRLTEVTRLIGQIAQEHGLTVVIEPLNRRECNMICSVAEGAGLAAAVDMPSVRLLADYYHIELDGEGMDEVCRVGGVQHVHVAAGMSRLYPMEEEPKLAAFLAALKKSGYDGLVSVEGRTEDLLADGPRAIRLLQAMWDRA